MSSGHMLLCAVVWLHLQGTMYLLKHTQFMPLFTLFIYPGAVRDNPEGNVGSKDQQGNKILLHLLMNQCS